MNYFLPFFPLDFLYPDIQRKLNDCLTRLKIHGRHIEHIIIDQIQLS